MKSDYPALVVEPDEIQRRLVSESLRKAGFTVLEAQNGFSGVTHLMDQPICLLIIDCILNDMDGFQFLKIFRNVESRDVPVFMVNENDQFVTESLDLRATDFFTLPIKPELFLKRVNIALDIAKRKTRSKYLDLLIKKEITESSKLTVKLQEMTQLKQKITHEIETPMTTVVNTIQELMTGQVDKEKYKESLAKILSTLSQHDLYQPAFVDQPTESLDQDTLDWLSNQYTTKEVERRVSVVTMDSNDVELQKVKFNIEEVAQDVPEIGTIDFDSSKFDYEKLSQLMVYLFHKMDFFNEFNFAPEKMYTLLGQLQTTYKKNSYHNFHHAIDVTQYIYMILQEPNIAAFLTSFEKFQIMMAGLFHDIDHPGVNNIYLINSKDRLATLYNDQSILENHHAYMAYQILAKPSCNVLSGLLPTEHQVFRRNFIKIILSTDMTQHFAIVSKFQARCELSPLDVKSEEDHLDLLKIIIKCADISNITRPFDVARKWAKWCVQEFFDQGDKEKNEKLPVGQLNDRNNLNFPKSQLGFVDFVAGVLFRNLCLAFPNLKFILENIEKNKELYKILLENQRNDISDEIDPLSLKQDVKEEVNMEKWNQFVKNFNSLKVQFKDLSETEQKRAITLIQSFGK